MFQGWTDLLARLSWPFVALVGVVILGPGGLLLKVVKILAENVIGIANSVKEFKTIADGFYQTQLQLEKSIESFSEMDAKIQSLALGIDSIRKNTADLAINEGSRSLEDTVRSEENGDPSLEVIEALSVEEMFISIRSKWETLTEALRLRIEPDQFDARSIGQMASRLTDRRRQNWIEKPDAEIFGRLHAQMKRFNRLQTSKDEWLTPDVYSAFVRGIQQALLVLGEKK